MQVLPTKYIGLYSIYPIMAKFWASRHHLESIRGSSLQRFQLTDVVSLDFCIK